MQKYGILVLTWPAVIGCEAAGVVIEVGEGVTKFKLGDYAYGCTRLGNNPYSVFQDTFIMEEDLVFKKSSNLTVEQASTVGVAFDVCLS
jgi:NADPH:quinone reductase-like Zn-dependent oxidoreductase